MVELKSFPIFYPPEGLYYICSKDFGNFWRQKGSDPNGGLIDCDMLGPAKDGEPQDHRIWKITWITQPTSKHGPRITLQCVQSMFDTADGEINVGGYVTKKSGRIMQTTKKVAWMLMGSGSKPSAFKLVTSDLRVSINAPTLLRPMATELRAEFHITSAYDMSAYDPQWWYFVPAAQIDTFLSSNGIERAPNGR